MSQKGGGMRVDAERNVRLILEAAERVLAADPAASVEQIADAAGVARATVHRRFSSRQALVDELVTTAVQRVADAIEAARPDVLPPLVALHQVTANVLRVKAGWRFALATPAPPGSAAAEGMERIVQRSRELFRHAQERGLVHPRVDPEWVRRVHFALIGEALRDEAETARDIDALATRVVETLLHGVGGR
jgi:AcrR family transcriptional regulator